MKDLAENNLVRFTNITKRKGDTLANFKVKMLRNGVACSASISVDITALDLQPSDSLEKIIEECARHGLKEFKRSDFQFVNEDLVDSDCLGVAQLG